MSRPRSSSLSRLFSLAILAGLALPAAARAGVMTRLTTNTADETGTDAALDVSGNIYVVYERSGSLYYRARTGTTWSAEEPVATGTNPAVGAGASGVPQVAFLSGGGVWFTARLGGTWMAPVRIGTGETVDLAVDVNDVGHVVYRGDYHGDGVRDIVYTNNSGGAFPPTPLRTWNGTDGGTAFEHFASPVIALDAGGHSVIAYHHHRMTDSGADWWTSIDVYMSATDQTYSSYGPHKYTNPYLTHNSLAVTDEGMAWVVYGTAMGRAGGGSYVEYPLPAGSSYAIARSAGAVLLYLAYVDDVDGTGAVNYMLFTAAGLGAPFVADGSSTGRNPVVVARTDAFVVHEAVDSGDSEVWFQRITNQFPVLDPIGNKSVDEGASLSFTVSATDGDGDALTYSASNVPTGASFDPATRTFSWTPPTARPRTPRA